MAKLKPSLKSPNCSQGVIPRVAYSLLDGAKSISSNQEGTMDKISNVEQDFSSSGSTNKKCTKDRELYPGLKYTSENCVFISIP